MCFFESYKTGCAVRIKLTPNAAFCGFGGVFTNADGLAYLKAYLVTAPEKGKANKELIKMLSHELQIPKNHIELISGSTSHLKKLYIQDSLSSELTNKLNNLVKEN